MIYITVTIYVLTYLCEFHIHLSSAAFTATALGSIYRYLYAVYAKSLPYQYLLLHLINLFRSI